MSNVVFDTDSIFYARQEEPTSGIQEGEQLEYMKREYYNSTHNSVEFVTAGPKNYVYRHVNKISKEDEQFVMKVRGFKLNSFAAALINFETVKQIM